MNAVTAFIYTGFLTWGCIELYDTVVPLIKSVQMLAP